MKQFEIVTEPIQTEQYREFTINEYQGAVVVFTGHVREWTKGVKTEYLEYEAYIPMAEKKLAQIGDEINEKWPGTITSIVHRIGPLQISDIAVLIAVSSPHRKDAYRANEYAIERIKEIVPIWKKKFGKMVQNGKGIKKGIMKKRRGRNKRDEGTLLAEIKDILQKAQEDIVLEQALTVQQFEDLLFERYPQINNKKFQVAVNEEFVQKSDFIQPNDTVALIPPVSGG